MLIRLLSRLRGRTANPPELIGLEQARQIIAAEQDPARRFILAWSLNQVHGAYASGRLPEATFDAGFHLSLLATLLVDKRRLIGLLDGTLEIDPNHWA